MKYISVFSGIEAASCAFGTLGMEPVAFAEVDKHASAVLAAHYPDVPNLGDVTKVDWKEYRGKVDLVVGGSPCQSFSIAGERGSKVSQVSCTSSFDAFARSSLAGSFGRTSQERSQASMGTLSDSSCPKWLSGGGLWALLAHS